MEISFVGSPNFEFDHKHIVFRFTDFLLQNKGYFDIFCDIAISAKEPNGREDKINQYIEEALCQRSIRGSKIQEFKELLTEYYKKCLVDTKLPGKLVEYLVSRLSPLTLKTKCSLETCYHAKISLNGECIDEKTLIL